jgi:hypothetical protein
MTNLPLPLNAPAYPHQNKSKEKEKANILERYMLLMCKYLLTENLIMLPTFIACFLSNLLTNASTSFLCSNNNNNNSYCKKNYSIKCYTTSLKFYWYRPSSYSLVNTDEFFNKNYNIIEGY